MKRRARWLSVCCGYTYTWVYRPGRVNVADPISRAPQHFPLLCVRTALAHSMKTCCYGRRLGALNVVASGRVPEGSPFMAPCCHVCSSAAVCVTTLPTRTLRSSVTGRDADATARPNSKLPLPPPPQTGPVWRSGRKRTSISVGGSDTPAVEPVPAPAVHKRCKQVTEVVQPATDASELDLSYPSTPEDDADANTFFRNNFFDRVVAGYAATSEVSQRLQASMSLAADTAGLLWTKENQLLVPDTDNLRFECYESVHAHPYAGHYGIMRTLKKAELLYYWPGMAKDIKLWIACCDPCQRGKAVQHSRGLLRRYSVTSR